MRSPGTTSRRRRDSLTRAICAGRLEKASIERPASSATVASLGAEGQLLKNGELVTGRLLLTRALALAWAETQRERLTREGWQPEQIEP